MVWPESLKIVEEQGYLLQLLSFQSSNPETCAKLKIIRAKILNYLKKSIKGLTKDSLIAYKKTFSWSVDQQPTLRNEITKYWFCYLAIAQYKSGASEMPYVAIRWKYLEHGILQC